MATLLVGSTCLCQSALSLAQSVVQADKFKGADAGEKIAQCLAALPETGGVCDARNLAGEQYSASGVHRGQCQQADAVNAWTQPRSSSLNQSSSGKKFNYWSAVGLRHWWLSGRNA